jgi:D-psicose/D-tagatose/L-ribulose 3-epimerase
MSFAGAAISNIAWPAEDDAEALDLVQAAGFAGIELAPAKSFGPWADIALPQVRTEAAALAARGLKVIALQGLLFDVPGAKLFGSDAERAALSNHLGFVARIAGACGGVPCVFGAPGARDPGALAQEAALERAAEFFAGIAPLFAAEGSALCIEANPVEYQCHFVTNTSEAYELAGRVATPGFGLHIDAGAILLNREDPQFLLQAGLIAAHCHASAPHLVPIGNYAAAYPPLAAALRRAGYSGWVSVEMRTASNWRGAIRDAGRTMTESWL